MVRTLQGRVIFVLHAQTDCNGVYPDITKEGIETLKSSAHMIRGFLSCDLNGNSNVIIEASPMTMTMGSAAIIASMIGYEGKVREEPSMQESITKARKKRFFKYLSKIVRCLLAEQQPFLNFICVTHYETLYHLVEDLFKDYAEDKRLSYGEIIVFSIFDIGIENVNVVEMEVTFREKTINGKFFDYKEQEIY